MLISGLLLLAQGILIGISICLSYLFLLAIASLKSRGISPSSEPRHRFAIVIPAHNEEAVIGDTIAGLQTLDYPSHLYDIHVISDNSTDRTAKIVRESNAICWERFDETRKSKGYALAWLFERLLVYNRRYDAVVVFDADSRVEPTFLQVMDAELSAGHEVIQACHVIANPADNWYTTVITIAFVMDNRLRNVGRSNLGFSAKLMGDGMCFGRHILDRFPWTAASLCEDTEYQVRLLLGGVHVRFAPTAITYGEIPTSLEAARYQRSRWMQGRAGMSTRLALQLLRAGLRNLNLAQLDGAVELVLPSCSTLLLLTCVCTLLSGALRMIRPGIALPWSWLFGLYLAFALYPLLALVLDGAPPRLYLYLACAPFYVLWRTGVRLFVRLRCGPTPWVRTARKTTNGQM